MVEGKTMPSATIARSDGDSHDFSVADRINYSGVTAYWQDTATPKNQNREMGVIFCCDDFLCN